MKNISPIYSAALLIGFISMTSALNIDYYGTCTLPNSEHGMCIPLEKCTYIYNIFQKTSLSDDETGFLKQSQCGYLDDTDTILVCCSERIIDAQSSLKIRLRPDLPQPGICGTMKMSKIFGGHKTDIDEFPWMTLIEYTEDGNSTGHHCGGSLINDRYVLTAAHCVTAISPNWIPSHVRLGEWDTTTDPDCEKDIRGYKYNVCADRHIDVKVEKIIVHENYDLSSKSHHNDIALIRLSHKINYTKYIQPICLPLADHLKQSDYAGQIMDISGWGRTETTMQSSRKLKAKMQIVPLDRCQRPYKEYGFNLESSQMCAGGELGIDSCKGDSGGPLIGLDSSNISQHYHFIAGVVSMGPVKCGQDGWPGVYTKVSEYVDWIQENMET